MIKYINIISKAVYIGNAIWSDVTTNDKATGYPVVTVSYPYFGRFNGRRIILGAAGLNVRFDALKKFNMTD